VGSLVTVIERGKEAEGVREHGVEENIWIKVGRKNVEWRRMQNEELSDMHP